jgi:dTDP-4-amino-4,6-dideoxygalactose transaminase
MKNIKLFDPVVEKTEINAVVKTIKSKKWASGDGKNQVFKFEEKFRKFVNSKACVAVNSGTSALHLAASLCDIKNKEVILPSLSFVSTAHAVIYNGGIPVFADIDPETLCINVEDVKRKISKKTKCIIPVHFGGMPAEIKKLQKLKSNLMVIEDAAHACGAKIDGKMIGSGGDFVCFSYHPVKNLAMPAGGSITINHKNYKKMELDLKSKRWCGISDRIGSDYDVDKIGWNFYMNELSASIGLSQLKKLNKLNKKRKKIAKIYHRELNVPRKMPFLANCSYHLYWICVKNRDSFRKKLFDKGIETGIHYKPIHKMSFYKKSIELPITEEIGKSIVTIPMHPNLNDSDVDKVIRIINKFV